MAAINGYSNVDLSYTEIYQTAENLEKENETDSESIFQIGSIDSDSVYTEEESEENILVDLYHYRGLQNCSAEALGIGNDIGSIGSPGSGWDELGGSNWETFGVIYLNG